MKESSKRIVVGTANFGLGYGLKNEQRKVPKKSVQEIIDFARQAGVFGLDTAEAYGNAETVLGQVDTSGLNLITKLSDLARFTSEQDLKHVLLDTKRRLSRTEPLYAVLAHSSKDLLGDRGEKTCLYLQSLRDEGLVQKIGVSIYDPTELDAIYDNLKPDILQFPFNALDQRIAKSKWSDILIRDGVELHARSVYLQGLLLFSRNTLPESFRCFSNDLEFWWKHLESNGRAPQEEALWFALASPFVQKIVVGIDHISQLVETLEMADDEQQLNTKLFSGFCGVDELINPFKWAKN